MTSPYIQNIVHPPIMPQRIVTRNRLQDLLVNNIDKNLILVYSPAGYGKTTLIQNFISKQNLNFGWLNVTKEIDHLFTFFKYLVYSLMRINDRFGKNTLEIIDSWNQRYLANNNPQNAINDIIATFIKEFEESFKEDIILVIDDLQYIEDSKWFKKTFDILLDLIPRNLHLIIITRQIPNLNILPLIEKGKMLKIGMEDLIFRFDEIIDLLKDIYSVEITENSIRLLENNLGGWITGIHLILQSYGKDINSIILDYQKIPENIFNFLADKIFKQLDTETQNFLVLSSMLEGFDPAVCITALEIKKSDEIIKTLLEKNLFIQPVPVIYNESDGYTVSFNYQILFKKFLNQKLFDLYNDDFIKETLKKVYKYYIDKGDIISALDNLIKTKDYKIFIPAIIEQFDKLFSEGKFEFLWKWMTQIEDEIDVHNPYIIYYLGILYKYYIGDLNKSLDYLQKAIQMFEKHNDQNALVGCCVMKANVLMNFGKTQEVIPELTNLLNKHTSKDIRSGLLYYLAYAYYQKADYDKATELLNDALNLGSDGRKLNKQTDIYNLLGNISLIKGNFKYALPYYEKALDNDPDLFNRIETICNVVLMYSQVSENEKSTDYLKQLDELMKKFPTPMFKLPYLLTKQGYLFEQGNYSENIKELEEINSLAKYTNHKQYLYLSYRFLTDSYYYLHDTNKAKYYLELSEQYVDKSNELENIELEVLHAALNGNSASNGDIEKTYLHAYDYYKAHEYTYSLVQIGYRLANLYFIIGDKEKSKQYLEESLGLAESNNYISYLLREYKYNSDLLNFGIEEGIHADFTDSIIGKNVVVN